MTDCSLGRVSVLPIPAYTDAMLISSNVAENDYDEFVLNKSGGYAVNDYVIVTDDGVHKIYQASDVDSAGFYPPDKPSKWTDRGATNRWKMLDGEASTQTENTDSIVIAIQPGKRISGIVLENISAAEINVTANSGATELMNEDYVMTDYSGITDFYLYLQGNFPQKRTLAILEKTFPTDTIFTITISKAGGTAKCGMLVIEQQLNIGELLYPFDLSLKYYPRLQKEIKSGTFSVKLENNRVDAIYASLPKYRDRKAVFLCGRQFDAQVIPGNYKKHSIKLSHPAFAIYDLSITGLDEE